MKTPNVECCICKKPMYRKPHVMKKARYFACMEHRAEALRLHGPSDLQKECLKLGRQPGTNHRTGYKHKEESKKKASESHKKWCLENPEKVKQRGAKNRKENHYLWKGGSSELNISIRLMCENRKWMDSVKERDNKMCTKCGSQENLESHHIVSLKSLIERYNIKNRDDARNCKELWDLSNGMTLCRKCHYDLHGRKYAD